MIHPINWANPYQAQAGKWLKGNLHTHSSPASACAHCSVEQIVSFYKAAGYDFLSISDHMALTQWSDDGLAAIPGVEWNSQRGEHTGVYCPDWRQVAAATQIEDQADLIDRLADTPSLLVLNHPNWQLRPHYRREELAERAGCHGIEIYNGVIERLSGSALATDKWDYLLASGMRVLGFACDDAHLPEDVGKGWICVRAAAETPESILQAVSSGSFYCSSGVEITEIARDGLTIEIATTNADEIRMICDGGKVVSVVEARSASFQLEAEQWSYVRIEAIGWAGKTAWTQPFFL